MNNKILSIILIFIFIGLMLVSSGCLMGNATHGSTSTSGGATTTSLTSAESYFANGEYSSAITKFQEVINGMPTDETKVKSFTGLGWAYIKMGNISSATDSSSDSNYENAITKLKIIITEEPNHLKIKDARLGLAGAYLYRAGSGDFSNAITQLEAIASQAGATFEYTPSFSTIVDLTNEEVHCMMALAYYLEGKTNKSIEQVNYIKSRESVVGGLSSNVKQTVDDLSAFLGI